MLEELNRETARRAHSAEIVGYAANSDAHHITPRPDGEGARNVMRLAIERAGVRPDHTSITSTRTE